jgi:hypothetical protein
MVDLDSTQSFVYLLEIITRDLLMGGKRISCQRGVKNFY